MSFQFKPETLILEIERTRERFQHRLQEIEMNLGSINDTIQQNQTLAQQIEIPLCRSGLQRCKSQASQARAQRRPFDTLISQGIRTKSALEIEREGILQQLETQERQKTNLLDEAAIRALPTNQGFSLQQLRDRIENTLTGNMTQTTPIPPVINDQTVFDRDTIGNQSVNTKSVAILALLGGLIAFG